MSIRRTTLWLQISTMILLSASRIIASAAPDTAVISPKDEAATTIAPAAATAPATTTVSAPTKAPAAKTPVTAESAPSLSAKIQGSSKNIPGTDTIFSALESAYQNNPDLAAEITKVNQADERMPQAKAGFRPSVTGSMKVEATDTITSGDFKRLGLNSTTRSGSAPSAQAGLEVKQNLYAGGATMASIKGAENTIKSARAKLLATEQQIFLQVIQSILEILLKQSEIDLYDGNIKLLEKTLDATQQRFDVGEETRTAVAQAEAQLASGRAQAETARGELEGLKATFKRLTGRNPGRLLKPDIDKNIPATLAEAIQLAHQNNPSIITSKFDEATARYEVDRISAALKPSIDLSARGTLSSSQDRSKYVGYGYVSGQNRRTAVSADVSMTIPLYEQGSVRSQKRAAHEAAAGARIGIESVSREVEQRLTTSWENYIAARANIESYKTQVKASQVSLEGTQQEVQVGTKIILDVLNAQKELLSSQLNLVRAEKTYLLEGFSILQWMGCLTAKQLKLKVKHYDPSIHYNETRGKL